MKLYLISRPNPEWDQSAGFVIVAPDEETARTIAQSADEGWGKPEFWKAAPIELIGKAAPGREQGVILHDYRAG